MLIKTFFLKSNWWWKIEFEFSQIIYLVKLKLDRVEIFYFDIDICINANKKLIKTDQSLQFNHQVRAWWSTLPEFESEILISNKEKIANSKILVGFHILLA